MVDLGTLEIGLKLDRQTLDRDINAVRGDLAKVSRNVPQINIKPFVDHQPLKDLNEHLDKKVKHLKEVNAYFRNNPVKVIYGYEGDFGSAEIGSNRSSSTVNNNYIFQDENIVGAIKNLGNDLKGLFKTSNKYTGETANNTKFKIIPNLFKGIFIGFAEKIGGTLASEFVESPTRAVSKNIKRSAQHIDQNVVGNNAVYETFLAELFSSGSLQKSLDASIPRANIGKVKQRVEKLVEIATMPTQTGDEVKKQIRAIQSDSELAPFLKQAKEIVKQNKVTKQGSTNLTDVFFDLAQPRDMVRKMVHPIIDGFQPLLRFISNMQNYNNQKLTEKYYQQRKGAFPNLEPDEVVASVIGGAQFMEGQGSREIALALHAIDQLTRYIPVENPQTDNSKANQQFDNFIKKMMAKLAPDLASNPHIGNNVVNALRQAFFAINPLAKSDAVAQAMANTRLAQEKGGKGVVTSYSLGGGESFNYAKLAEYMGVDTDALAMAYPFFNWLESVPKNFKAVLSKQDPLGFVDRVGINKDNKAQSIVDTGSLPSTDAHGIHHLFKSDEFVAQYLDFVNKELVNPSTKQNLSPVVKGMREFFRTVGLLEQISSYATTEKFDPKSIFKGFDIYEKQKPYSLGTMLASLFEKKGSVLGAFTSGGNALEDPTRQAIGKFLAQKFDLVEKQIREFFAKKNITLPDDNLSGYFKYEADANYTNELIAKTLDGTMGLDEVKERLSVHRDQTIGWFSQQTQKDTFGENYVKKIIAGYKEFIRVAEEAIKTNGKFSKSFIDTVKYSPANKEVVDIFNSASLDTMKLDTEEQARGRKFNISKAIYEDQASITAYNKILNAVGKENIPKATTIKAIGSGMSGARALMTQDMVYKTDLDPSGASLIGSDAEVDAYERLQGRYSPLLYKSVKGQALITERVKGTPVKDILDKAVKPYKDLQEKIKKLREQVNVEKGKDEPDKLIIDNLKKEIKLLDKKAKEAKVKFNEIAKTYYEKIGELASTLKEFGVVHNDLASGNVFELPNKELVAIDFGRAKTGHKNKIKSDELTTIQRAIIDLDYMGIMDIPSIIGAIKKGYKKQPTSLQLPRQLDQSKLNLPINQQGVLLENKTADIPLLQQLIPDLPVTVKKANKKVVATPTQQGQNPLPLFAQQFYQAPPPVVKPIDLSQTQSGTIGEQLVNTLQTLSEIKTALIQADSLIVKDGGDDDNNGGIGDPWREPNDPNNPPSVTIEQRNDKGENSAIKVVPAKQTLPQGALATINGGMAIGSDIVKSAQQFYRIVQKAMGKASGVIAPVYQTGAFLEDMLLDALPMGKTMKKVIQASSPVAIGYGLASTGMLPPALVESGINVAQMGTGAVANWLAGGASAEIANLISSAFGGIPFSEGVIANLTATTTGAIAGGAELGANVTGASLVYYAIGKQVQNFINGLFDQVNVGTREKYIQQTVEPLTGGDNQRLLPPQQKPLYTLPDQLSQVSSVDDLLVNFVKSTAKGKKGRDVEMMVANNLKLLAEKLRELNPNVEQKPHKLNNLGNIGKAIKQYSLEQVLSAMQMIPPQALYNKNLASLPSGVAPIDNSALEVRLAEKPKETGAMLSSSWERMLATAKTGQLTIQQVNNFLRSAQKGLSAIKGIGGEAGKVAQSLSGIIQQAIKVQEDLRNGIDLTNKTINNQPLPLLQSSRVASAIKEVESSIQQMGDHVRNVNSDPRVETRQGSLWMETSKIRANPQGLQYKKDGVNTKTGASGSISPSAKWNEQMAGTIAVWKDPNSDEFFVVNGHNRLAHAKSQGVNEVKIEIIDAPNMEKARAQGALKNISEGQGKVRDASDYFRSIGAKTIADIQKVGFTPDTTFSRGGGTVKDALGLAQLGDDLYRIAGTSRLSLSLASAIGLSGAKKGQEQQDLLKYLREKGKGLSGSELGSVAQEMASMMRSGGIVTKKVEQGNLLGLLSGDDPYAQDFNLMFEQAKAIAYVQGQFRSNKKLARQALGTAKSGKYVVDGQAIDVKQAQTDQEKSDLAIRYFDQFKSLTGSPINKAINQSARKILDNNGVITEQIGKDLIAGVLKGIEQESVKIPAQQAKVADKLVSGIEDPLQISSPSRVFMEIGRNIGEGLYIGVGNSIDQAVIPFMEFFRELDDLMAKEVIDFTQFYALMANVSGMPIFTQEQRENSNLIVPTYKELGNENFEAVNGIYKAHGSYNSRLNLVQVPKTQTTGLESKTFKQLQTIAHEIRHALQFGYTASKSSVELFGSAFRNFSDPNVPIHPFYQVNERLKLYDYKQNPLIEDAKTKARLKGASQEEIDDIGLKAKMSSFLVGKEVTDSYYTPNYDQKWENILLDSQSRLRGEARQNPLSYFKNNPALYDRTKIIEQDARFFHESSAVKRNIGTVKALGVNKAYGFEKERNLIMQGKGKDVVDGLRNEIDAQENILRASGGKMANALITGFDKPMQISSPSKLFQYFGRMIVEGLALGLESNKPISILDKLGNGMKQAFQSIEQRARKTVIALAVENKLRPERGSIGVNNSSSGLEQSLRKMSSDLVPQLKQGVPENKLKYKRGTERAISNVNPYAFAKSIAKYNPSDSDEDNIKNIAKQFANSLAVGSPQAINKITEAIDAEYSSTSTSSVKQPVPPPHPTASYQPKSNNQQTKPTAQKIVDTVANEVRENVKATKPSVKQNSLPTSSYEAVVDPWITSNNSQTSSTKVDKKLNEQITKLNKALVQAFINQDFDKAIQILQELSTYDQKYTNELERVKKAQENMGVAETEPVAIPEQPISSPLSKGQQKRNTKRKNKEKKQRRDYRAKDSDFDAYMAFSIDELEQLKTSENEKAINYVIGKKKSEQKPIPSSRPRRHNPTNPIMFEATQPVASQPIVLPHKRLEALKKQMDEAFQTGDINRQIEILRKMAKLDSQYNTYLQTALNERAKMVANGKALFERSPVTDQDKADLSGNYTGGRKTTKERITSTLPTSGGGSGKPPNKPPTATYDDDSFEPSGNFFTDLGHRMKGRKAKTIGNDESQKGLNIGAGMRSGINLVDNVLRNNVGKGTYRGIDSVLANMEANVVGTANTIPSLGETWQQFSKIFSTISQESPQAGRALNFFKDIVISAFGTAGIWSFHEAISAVMRDTTRAFLQMEQIELGVRFTQGSGTESKMKELMAQSRQLGVDFETVGRGYSKLAIASKDTAIEPQIDFIFSGFLQAFRTRQVNPEAQGRALLALEQMISKEKISAEELRLQLSEAIPGAMGVGARAMGMSGLELADMLQSGQLTAGQFLPRFSAQLQMESATLAPYAEKSLQGSINKLNSEIFTGQAIIGESLVPVTQTGITALSKVLEVLNNNAELVTATMLGLAVKLISIMIPSMVNVASNSGFLTVALRLIGIEYSRTTKTAISSASASAIARRAEELYTYAKQQGAAISMTQANRMAFVEMGRSGQMQSGLSMANAGAIAVGFGKLALQTVSMVGSLMALGLAIDWVIKAFKGATGMYNEDLKNANDRLADALEKFTKTPENEDSERNKRENFEKNLIRYSGLLGGIVGGGVAVGGGFLTGGTTWSQIGTFGAAGSFIADQAVKMATGKEVVTDKNTNERTVVSNEVAGWGKAQDRQKKLTQLQQNANNYIDEVNKVLTGDKLVDINKELVGYDNKSKELRAKIFAKRNSQNTNYEKINEYSEQLAQNEMARDAYRQKNLGNVVELGSAQEEIENQIDFFKKNERDLKKIMGNAGYETELKNLEGTLARVKTATDNLNQAMKTSENLLKQVVLGFGEINRELANSKFGEVLKTGEETNRIRQQRASGNIVQYEFDVQMNKAQQESGRRNLGFTENAIKDMEAMFRKLDFGSLGTKLQPFGYRQGESMLDFFKRQSPESLNSVTQEIGKLGSQDDLLPAERESLEQAQRYLNLLQEQVTVKGQTLDLEIQARQLARDRAIAIRDFDRRKVDLGLQIENAMRQQKIDLRGLLRQQDDFVNQTRLSARNLVQSFGDLNIQINRKAIELNNQIKQAVRDTERVTLGNDLNRLMKPGDGLFTEFTNLFTRAMDIYDNFQTEEENINLQVLDVEQQKIQIARQIRDLQEQAHQLEIQRLRQLEDLATAQDTYAINQKQTWMNIARSVEDMYTQAQIMGVKFENIADYLGGIAGHYLKINDIVAKVAKDMQNSANNIPSVSSSNGQVTGNVVTPIAGLNMNSNHQWGANRRYGKHWKVDYADVKAGDAVVAPIDGILKATAIENGESMLTLRQGNVEIILGHIREAIVDVGKEVQVSAGQKIGVVGGEGGSFGSTGRHLDYGVKHNGNWIHPNLFHKNPEKYLPSTYFTSNQTIPSSLSNTQNNFGQRVSRDQLELESRQDNSPSSIQQKTPEQKYNELKNKPNPTIKEIKERNKLQQELLRQRGISPLSSLNFKIPQEVAIEVAFTGVSDIPLLQQLGIPDTLNIPVSLDVDSRQLMAQRLPERTNYRDEEWNNIQTPRDAIIWVSKKLQVNARDLAALASFESGSGNFSTSNMGGDGNNYMGWLQLSPDAREKLGVQQGVSQRDYALAVVRYFKEFRAKPLRAGASLQEIYNEINPGFGNVRPRLERDGHFQRADKLLGGNYAETPSYNNTPISPLRTESVTAISKLGQLAQLPTMNVNPLTESDKIRIAQGNVPNLDIYSLKEKQGQNIQQEERLSQERRNLNLANLLQGETQLINQIANLNYQFKDKVIQLERAINADNLTVLDFSLMAKGFNTLEESLTVGRLKAIQEFDSKVNQIVDSSRALEKEINVTKEKFEELSKIGIRKLLEQWNIKPPSNLEGSQLIEFVLTNNRNLLSDEQVKILEGFRQSLANSQDVLAIANEKLNQNSELLNNLNNRKETFLNTQETRINTEGMKKLNSSISSLSNFVGSSLTQKGTTGEQKAIGLAFTRIAKMASLNNEVADLTNPINMAELVANSGGSLTKDDILKLVNQVKQQNQRTIMFETSGYNEMKTEFGQLADMMNSIGGQLNQRGDLLRGNWLTSNAQAIQTKIQVSDMKLGLQELFKSGRLGDVNTDETKARFNSLNASIEQFEKNSLAKLAVDNNFVVSGLVDPMKTAITGLATIMIDKSKSFWEKVNDIMTNFLTSIANHSANNFSTAVTTWITEKLAQWMNWGVNTGTESLDIATATALNSAGIKLDASTFMLDEASRSQTLAAWELAQVAAKLNASLGVQQGGQSGGGVGGSILNSAIGAFMQPIASLGFGSIVPDTGVLSNTLTTNVPSVTDYTTGFTAGGKYAIADGINMKGWGNYAKGGLVEQAQKALAKERMLGGGKAVLSALTVGEYVVPKNPHRKDIAKLFASVPMARNMRIENYAKGGMVGKASSMGSMVTNNSRMETRDNSFVSNIYVNANDVGSFRKTRYQLEMEENARLARSARRF